MDMEHFLTAVQARGVRFLVVDGKLRSQGAQGALSAAELDWVRAHREHLLAHLLARQDAARPTPLQAGPRPARLPLSHAQQRLWFLDQMDPGSPFNNIPAAFVLRGELSITALRTALQGLVARHESLRTRFLPPQAGEEEPSQQVMDADMDGGPSVLEVEPMPQLSGLDPQALWRRCADHEARQPFDLSRGPLLRVRLLLAGEGGGEAHLLLITVHHIIADGWSMSLLMDELRRRYEAARQGKPPDLPPLPLQVADHALWQRSAAQQARQAASLRYWQQRLQGAAPLLSLPTDFPRPRVQGRAGAHQGFLLPASLAQGLRSLGQSEGATLFMVLQAGLALLLGRWAGQSDVCLGTPVAGRTERPLEPLIGCFLNTLVLRTDLSEPGSFRKLLRTVRQDTLEAFEHQDLPFERLVDALNPERSTAHSPLYQVMLILQNTPAVDWQLPGLSLQPLAGESGAAKLDLRLSVSEAGQGLHCDIEYRTELFLPETMERFAQAFETLLGAAVADPDQSALQLPSLPPAEQARRLAFWRAHMPGFDTLPQAALQQPGTPRCVLARWAQRVAAAPQGLALQQGRQCWSHAQLAHQAQLRALTLQQRGLKPGQRVALLMDDPAEHLQWLLAVMLCGGVFASLDPGQPRQRLQAMLDSAAPVHLLHGERLAALAGELQAESWCVPVNPVPDLAVPGLAAWPGLQLDGDAPAYLYFTSGSTGQPKGVLGRSGGLAHFIDWEVRTFGLDASERASLLTPASFDVHLREVFAPLAAGGSLHVPPPLATLAPEALRDWLEEAGISLVHAVPTLWRHLMAAPLTPDRLPALRRLLLAGEPLLGADVQRWRSAMGTRVELVNLYGPTETTLAKCCYRVPADGAWDGQLPVGRPLPGAQLLVLDEALQLCAPGQVGEVYLRTPYRSLGYLEAGAGAGLNAQAFVPNPFNSDPQDRLYRSGDLGAVDDSGQLCLRGRRDAQLKLHGVRVELGEVEAALARLPGVQSAAARVHRQGEVQCLVGYLRLESGVPAPDAAQMEAWQARLRLRLPEAWCPGELMVLAQFPLTRSGKLDRQALPGPQGTVEADERPRPGSESALAAIWQALLGGEPPGRRAHFFRRGGHSLLATRLVARLNQQFGVALPLRAVFEAPELQALAQRLDQLRGQPGSVPAVPRLPRSPGALQRFEASPGQERLWFLHQLEGAAGASLYNTPLAQQLSGPLDPESLRRAWAQLVTRHELLRADFEQQADGALCLRVHPEASPILDWLRVPDAAAAQVAVDTAAARPFQLDQAPLARALCVQWEEAGRDGGAQAQAVLLLVLHHSITDGVAQALLMEELWSAYRAACGEALVLPALTLQYPDYAAWQRSESAQAHWASQRAHWQARLAGAPALLELPTDRPRPARPSPAAASVQFQLRGEVRERLLTLCAERDCTLFMLVSAVLGLLLGRSSGQRDLCLGTPVANRQLPGTETLLGFFVNTLALRLQWHPDMSLADWLGAVREVALDAFAHQDLPFDQLVEALDLPRSTAHAPLFQVLLVVLEPARPLDDAAGLRRLSWPVGGRGAKFDLSVGLQDDGERLVGALEYRCELFDRETVERLADTLVRWLELAAEGTSLPLGRWPLCTPLEEQRITQQWNATGASPQPPVWMHQWPARQLASHAEATALVVGTWRRSYAQLETESNRLAQALCLHGAGPEQRVAVCLGRQEALVPVLLAILKTGAAYVPLDPTYPQARLHHLLADSRPLLCVVDEGTRALLDEIGAEGRCQILPWARLHEQAQGLPASAPQVEVHAEQLAYVIYTSGSTGRPKGVGITHGNAAAFLAWTRTVFEPDCMRAVLAATSVCFDLSIFEIFAPWAQGGACWLAPSILALAEEPGAWPVTLVNTVPSAMSELLRLQALPSSVQVLNLAGEMLPRALVQALHAASPRLRVFNLYGPTEDTTYSSWELMAREDAGPCLIGRPMLGSQAYVLDELGQLLPPGVSGELYLGGEGLARGYLDQPAMTAERFLPDPWSRRGGARLYRTGDRARYRRDGRIECLGRLDHQVKLRGFRVELGEIEAVLAEHPALDQVLVCLRPDAAGHDTLAAYYSCRPSERDPGPAALRALAARRLPSHMLPAHCVALAAFPLTPNGKLDRAALPVPDAGQASSTAASEDEDTEAWLDETEARLASAWATVLGRPPRSRQADFFQEGGHSLLATRLIAALRAAGAAELPLRAVFEAPRLAALAERLRAAQPTPRTGALGPRPAGAPARLSLAQQRLWFLQHLDGERSPYQIATALQLSGPLDLPALRGALALIVDRHEVLRSVFQTVEGQACLGLLDDEGWRWQEDDLSDRPWAEARAQALWTVQDALQQGFDIARGPLFQARLLRLAPEASVLLLRMHHIVSDGWSLGVLMSELGQAYAALCEGRDPAWAPLPLQYADHAHWQHEAVAAGALESQRRYWVQRLQGAPRLLALPADHARPAQPGFRGARLPFRVDAATRDALQRQAQAAGASLFMILAAALHVLLARLSRQSDLCLGLPIANRRRAELEPLIGFFANTLVLRTESRPEHPFSALLAQVRERLLEAYEHQDLPFEHLVDALGLSREAAVNPLFQVMLVLQNAPLQAPVLPGLAVEPLAVERAESQFDLTVAVEEGAEGLQGVFEYSSELFEAATVQAWVRQWERLLQSVAAGPEQAVGRLTLDDAQQLRQRWRSRQGPAWLARGPLHAAEAFATQVAAWPDRLAVVDAARSLSFAELDDWAEALAACLQDAGAGPERRVALCLDRSWRMVGAVLAVWKAGAAYVPLDPAYPAARRQAMLDDAQPLLVLGDERHREALAAHGLPLLCVDEARPAKAGRRASPVARHPAQAAYVIYTSGSTGRPKGVVGTHEALMRLAQAHAETLLRPLGPGPHACSFNAALVFDASLSELSLMLDGQTLHVLPDDVRLSPELLRAFLVRHDIAVFDTSPAQLRYLLDAGLEAPWPARMVCGGEALDPALWARLAGMPGTQVINAYGPTEATVDVVWTPVAGSRPMIGRPQPGVGLALLDPLGEPVAEGQPGELHVSGVSLARGYLGQPGLSAERFLPDPDGPPGSRRYATGDLCRWREDLGLEYLGRVDQQVKLRGFRIELEDVEAQLRTLPGVQSAAVTLQPGEGGAQLAAHVLPQPWIGPPRAGGPLVLRPVGAPTGDPVWTACWELDAEAWPLGLLRHRSPLRLQGLNEGRATTLQLHPQWRSLFDALHAEAWPAYFRGSAVLGEAWEAMYAVFPQAQMLLREGRDELLGVGNAVLLHWDGQASTLPAGWEGALRQGLADQAQDPAGRAPNTLVVLAGVIDPRHKARKLAGHIVAGFKGLAAQLGLDHVLVALRPLDKVAHPTLPIQDYVRLEDAQGRPLDRWLRLHLEAGGELLGTEAASQRVEASLADWQAWCGEPPASGDVWCPGDTLAPVRLDRSGGRAVYEEPCVWVRHAVLGPPSSGPALSAREAWAASGGRPWPQLWVLEQEAWPEGDLESLRELLARESQAARLPAPLSRLREQLQARLPQYMVPTLWAWCPQLPLSAGGKLDRKALPTLQATPALGSQAPLHPQEALLCAVWEEVLGVRPVGPDDNFFALGGDSIQSIRMLARAKEQGLVFSTRQVFEHQTVRALLSQLQRRGLDLADQGAVRGGLSLLPIQREFLEAGGADLHHFNQAALLCPPQSLDLGALQRMARVLVARHDALRLVFRRGEDGWQAEHQDWDERRLDDWVQERLLPDRDSPGAGAALQQALAEAQAGFDLARGPLARWLLLCDERGPWRLLWVVHHLVVDGVSWRVMLQDLETLWSQNTQDAELRLARKTASLQQWGQALLQHAQGPALAGEREDWRWVQQAPVDTWPLGEAQGPDCVAQTRVLSLRLEEAQTQSLLGPCHQAFGTQINDLLLAALAWALQRWAGIRQFRLDLEGHGREPLEEGLDLGETVGWFTSVHPVWFCGPTDPQDLRALILGVKERLRAVPGRGLGYGLLTQLSADPLTVGAPAPLLFNYLGQFGGARSDGPGRQPAFMPAPEPGGPLMGAGLRRTHPLVINGGVYQGRLMLSLDFNAQRQDLRQMQALLDTLQQGLQAVCSYTLQQPAPAWPDAEGLHRPLEQGPVPSMPNHGWFFRRLDLHHWNAVDLLTLHEAYPPALVARAVQQLLAHHDALRSVWVEGPGGWQQWLRLPSEMPPSFFEVDLGTVPPAERSQALERLCAELQASLDIRHVLFKAVWVGMGEAEAPRVLLLYHHLLVDKYACAVLVEDLTRLCQALSAGQAPRLGPKTAGMKALARAWHRQAAELPVDALLPSWQRVQAQGFRPWPASMASEWPGGPSGAPPGTPPGVAAPALLRTALSAQDTARLLARTTSSADAGVSDWLLLALAEAYGRISGSPALQVIQVHNGRSGLPEDLDLSRTVGWCGHYAVLPVDLVGAQQSLASRLARVREAQAALAGQEAVYSQLRDLHPDPAVRAAMARLPDPQIEFQYHPPSMRALGSDEDGPIRKAAEHPGATDGPMRAGFRPFASAIVDGEELVVVWAYCRTRFSDAAFRAFAQSVLQALVTLLDVPAPIDASAALSEAGPATRPTSNSSLLDLAP